MNSTPLVNNKDIYIPENIKRNIESIDSIQKAWETIEDCSTVNDAILVCNMIPKKYGDFIVTKVNNDYTECSVIRRYLSSSHARVPDYEKRIWRKKNQKLGLYGM